MAGIDAETLVGMLEACFSPDGRLSEEGSPSQKAMLEGYLELAKQEKLDPEALYKEAVSNLSSQEFAPDYPSVAPR